ncbi:glycosyltransferase family 39 protein [Streptomyces palmae]|uniref:glycosyltransferase family 39 protein n=1 Tax=Streptomyces palmae TaxID=1701085 RepID=UPI001432849D|nr:glycosyltransferase family 39 protein [Streptomyces palmae]
MPAASLLGTRESARKNVDRARGAFARALPALGLYAAVRLAGMIVVAVCALLTERHPRTVLGHSWDAVWYAGVAQHGYGTVIISTRHPGRVYNDLAFFPLFPALQRAVSTVLPVGTVTAGLLVALVCAGLAAWGVYMVGERLYGHRVGVALVLLWGLLPHAIVQTMAYSESLLTALAAWSLYSVLTRRWLWAGSLAALAGLARPNGIAVAAAVVVGAAIALAREPRTRRSPRPWLAIAIAPMGWVGYLAWVGLRVGRPLGYFEVQRQWGTSFDFGRYTTRFGQHLVLDGGRLSYFTTIAVLFAALLALILLVLDRPPLPIVVYALVLAVMAFGGTRYFSARPRLLMPAFTLLLPAALALARARVRTGAVLAGGLAVVSLSYGIYLTMLAPTAP